MCHGELFETQPSLLSRVVERLRGRSETVVATGNLATLATYPEAAYQALSERFATMPPDPQRSTLYAMEVGRLQAARRWEAQPQANA